MQGSWERAVCACVFPVEGQEKKGELRAQEVGAALLQIDWAFKVSAKTCCNFNVTSVGLHAVIV